MRIGVSRGSSNLSDGSFYYEFVMLDALSQLAGAIPEELLYFTPPQNSGFLNSLASAGGLSFRGLPIRPLYELNTPQAPLEAYLSRQPQPRPTIGADEFYADLDAARHFRAQGVDLIFQISPYSPPFAPLLPFITAIYDLNHRLQPEFPEVSANSEYELREYRYGNICRYATLVLVDSEIGKEDVLNCYGDVIDADRIRVLPYYPPVRNKPAATPEDCARVAAKYNLPKRYFFYPAQLWRHKNHALILCAIALLSAQHGAHVPVVFCGSYSNYHCAVNFSELMSLAARLGVTDRVHYLGPVPDEDMAALYGLSAGLVMPTFFGPTNLPPLEAWHYGRPVITSDIRGLKEQLGDAGLLADPRSPEALADAMLRIWSDANLAEDLVTRGRRRLAQYTWDEFLAGVRSVIADASDRVRSGRTPRFPDFDI